MNHRRRNLLRLAADIHSGLTQQAPSVVVPCWPTDAWQGCQDLLRKIERAERRNWLLAADQLRQELAFALALLRGQLTEASECLQSACDDGRSWPIVVAVADAAEIAPLSPPAPYVATTTCGPG